MRRPTAHKRGYDKRWLSGRTGFLEEHPYCLGCSAIGVQRAATVVDHIIPHEGNKERFWDTEFQPLCDWHHNSIKPMLEREWSRGKLSDAVLRMNSPQAVKLTRARHRPAVGPDGYAIPGT